MSNMYDLRHSVTCDECKKSLEFGLAGPFDDTMDQAVHAWAESLGWRYAPRGSVVKYTWKCPACKMGV